MTRADTSTVTARVEEFIALRRGLGYRSPSPERALRAFGRLSHRNWRNGACHSPIPTSRGLM